MMFGLRIILVWAFLICALCAAVAVRASEAPGPSSRRTALAISEIMYHSADPGENLEFVELHNTSAWPEDISGYRLGGDIGFPFPSNTLVAADGYLVVAGNVSKFILVNGSSNVLGSFTNSLPNSGGTVRLLDRAGAILLEVKYGTDAPWPVLADGKAYSLVLARPSLGEADPRAWESSRQPGGSPGRAEPVAGDPLHDVVINELLANSALPDLDFIEFYNRGQQDVDISGCSLSNDPDTNKFTFQGAIIPAGSYLALDESPWGLGFRLKADGDTVYFRGPANAIIDAVRYGPQLNGVSLGRVPEGGPDFYPLSPSTPFARNDTLYAGDIVINEIMYAPISGSSDDEYVELYNRRTNAVNVGGWAFIDGIIFTNPPNTVIPPLGYLVVAKKKSNLFAKYPQLSSSNTVGNYSGSLASDGERIALARPQTNVNNGVITVGYAVVDEVTYGTGGRWGQWSRRGGSSLELVDARSENRLAANWADSDEAAKALWTTVEFTGTLDNGYPHPPTNGELQVLLLGAGECLVDNVEAFFGGGANLVANWDLESGLTNWVIQGNHERSSLEETGFGGSSHSLHLRASGPGDTGGNQAAVRLAFPPIAGTLTLRAQVKWLRGKPDILLRLKGNYLEAAGHLDVPPNLGTPGLPNSRALPNAGPAIFDVRHAPILPAALQRVVVTAQVHDPDGLGSLQLRYRIDPGSNFASVPMVDDGTGGDARAGDGWYSATIPGRPMGTLVAFYLEASDAFSPPATTRFPIDAPQRECLVRFGEPLAGGSFGSYHFWLTASNMARWASRGKFSNEPIDATVVYGSDRVIYQATVRYGGDPWRRTASFSPTNGPSPVLLTLPSDDLVLGSQEIVLDPVDPAVDGTALREMTASWMAEQLGLPANHDRFVQLVVNGVPNASRGVPIYLDREVPNNAYTASRFSTDSSGELFEISDWVEFFDGNNPDFSAATGADLNNYVTTGAVKKQARYRWNWRKQPDGSGLLDDDYSSLFALVDSMNAPDITYLSEAGAALSDEWINALAFRHVIGDSEGYGYTKGRNEFAYKGEGQPWKILFNLFRLPLGASGGDAPNANLFATGDTNVARLYNQPELRRSYLRSLQRAANGPLLNSLADPILDARYQALLTNGVTVTSPTPIKSWISGRRAYIAAVAQTNSPPFAISTPTNLTVDNDLVRITGTGDLSLQYLYVIGLANSAGATYYPTWETPTTWSIHLFLTPGVNNLVLYPNGLNGVIMTITYTGAACPSPQGLVVINEIMYNPATPGASYIELYNTSPTCSFDLSNWRLDGVGFTFPAQTYLTNGGYLLLARDRAAFTSAYGLGIPIAGLFPGELDPNGETLTLVIPRGGLFNDVIVDKVRYETSPPWPTGARGTGLSLQLIDPEQDNARAGNWADGSGWRFASVTGNIGATSNGLGTNLHIFVQLAGEAYIDDVSLVPLSGPSAGLNLIQNGDFEAPLSAGPWIAAPGMSASGVSSAYAHSGRSSLHIVNTNAGSVNNNSIHQNFLPVNTNILCTLSFWYHTTSSTNVTVRTFPGSFVNTNVSQLPMVGTPGAGNSVAAHIPPYPLLWINEVQPVNPDGFQDNTGTPQPWVELFNNGANDLLLDGFFLSKTYTPLSTLDPQLNWAFPTGTVISAGEFKVIFTDGQSQLSTGTVFHTSFRLDSGTGSVALARTVAGQIYLLDHVNFSGLTAGQSFGSFPDGQQLDRGVLTPPTPGARNRPPPVFINEWMAKNNSTIRDPADNNFDDWFELYNAATVAIDLSGYYLYNSGIYWSIPAVTVIPARGFLLVWADNETYQNGSGTTDLHAPFKLNKSGDAISLLTPGGIGIGSVIFGRQSADISQGRWPDGAGNTYTFPRSTPRGSNVASNAAPPFLAPISNSTVNPGQTLSLYAPASDAETPFGVPLVFSLDAGAPTGAVVFAGPTGCSFSWTPTAAQAPSINLITLRVTDYGLPPLSATRSFTVVVLPPNHPPVLAPIGNQTIMLGETLSLTASATDPDAGQSLIYSLLPGAPFGAVIDPASGLFQWPSLEQPFSGNQITIKVADNGTPSLSASNTFVVLVTMPPATLQQISPGKVAVSFPTIIGRRYEIEYKDDLAAPAWIGLGPFGATTTSTTVIDNNADHPQRFYRIVSY